MTVQRVVIKRLKKTRVWNSIFGIIVLTGLYFFTGCSPTSSRVGVTMTPCFLYSKYETPLTLRRLQVERFQSLVIPDKVSRGESTAYCIALNIPGIPGSQALSVGWGDMSIERALKNGGLQELLFADAEEMTILRIFTRVRIKVYGIPEE